MCECLTVQDSREFCVCVVFEYALLKRIVTATHRYCPDICPAELQKMGRVMDDLKIRGRDELVVPLMISVDPRRDTVQALANYVRDFHPRLIGLTG